MTAAAPEREPGRRGIDGETVAATGRFATIWVRPGPQATPSRGYAISPPAGGRSSRRRVLAGAFLVGGAALAWAASVGLGTHWPRTDRAPAVVAGAAPAAPVEPPAPVASPAPEPIPHAAPPERAPKFVPRDSRKRALAAAAAQASSKTSLVNPTPEDRGCVPRALRANRDVVGRLPSEIAVRLRVAATGDVGQIEVLNPPDRDVVRAIDDAVRSCRFSPGTDEEGHAISLPIVMRIRFASREATAGF